MRTTLIVVSLLFLACLPAQADDPSLLAGRWTYDAKASRPVEPDLRITRTTAGPLHAEGGSSAPYDFDLTGGTYPLSNGRTISWASTARNAWRATKARQGDVLETITVTLARNTLRSATRGKLPDGSPYERTVTYQRVGRGEGLEGRWRSIKVDTGATWDGFVVTTDADGVVTWRIPTDLQVITGKFDGGDLDIVGPNGPIGSTIAVRPVSPLQFDYVMKNGGHVAQRGTLTISNDRRVLTELGWDEDQPDRKSKLVYRREP